MKKKSLKSLSLKKRSISNFNGQLNGGELPETKFAHTCYAAECNLDSMPPIEAPIPVPVSLTCMYSIDVCPLPPA